MKRNWILRLALCLVLAVALVPVTARAAGNLGSRRGLHSCGHRSLPPGQGE